MDYQQTINWLFHRLPMYQNQGAKAYKKDLTNTLLLMDYLGNPAQKIKTIHVAGTNGKGSTSHMLASVLQAAGYKVGLYTSPHLIDFRERIKINGQEISENYVVDFVGKHRLFFENHQLSFFEMTVGLAFEYFKDQQTDVNIIETGLGGRLDSTNVIKPLISVITNIGFDHVQFLGDTLPKIAGEKAGIIKDHTPVVIGEYQEETFPVFEHKALSVNAPIYKAFNFDSKGFESDLKGWYQAKNIKSVLTTISILKEFGFVLTDYVVKDGLMHVVRNTGLMGRYQVMQSAPKVICDTAHNKEGLQLVMAQLNKESFDHLHIIFGVVDDKNLDSVWSLLPKGNTTYYFTKPSISRGLPIDLLENQANMSGIKGDKYETVQAAFEKVLLCAQSSDVIYVGGSTFVVADFLRFYNGKLE